MPVVLLLVDRGCSLKGVIDVPLYEAPFNPLPASVVAGWQFEPNSWWPNIGAQAPSLVPNAVLRAVDVHILTQFVYSRASFPTATTTISTYLNQSRPIHYGIRLWDRYTKNTGVDSYWTMAALPGVNTFTPNVVSKTLFDANLNPGWFGTVGNRGLFISRFGFPAFASLIVKSAGNQHGFAYTRYDNDMTFVFDDLFTTPGFLTFDPLYSVPDFANNFTHIMHEPSVGHPKPIILSIRHDVGDNRGTLVRIVFDRTDINNAFDLGINGTWPNASGAFPLGHVLVSPGTNAVTPGMLGTVILMDYEGSNYYIVNFIPQTSKGRAMLAAPVTSWRVKLDVNGNFYFGSNADNRWVLESRRLVLPFPWPQARMPSIALPCGGSCVPVPLNIPAI